MTQGAVEKKTTIPILANLLLDAGSGEVNLAATNLDLGIKSSCVAQVDEPGTVTTPAKNFMDILRSLPDEEVRIKKLENNWLRIECASASFKLVGCRPTISYTACVWDSFGGDFRQGLARPDQQDHLFGG